MKGNALALRALRIRTFRNLTSVDVELGPGINVVWGDNGQGKTNFVEAIYALATSKSFRTSRAAEMIGRGHGDAMVRGVIHDNGEEREQSLAIGANGRVTRLDGKPPVSLTVYAVRTPVVAFHPGALVLASGASSERRKLLDRIGLYFSPSAADERRKYVHALRSRQRALERRGENAKDLPAWEDQMVTHGLAIQAVRAQAAEALGVASLATFAQIGGSTAKLRVKYAAGAPADAETFRAELAMHRAVDRIRRSPRVGPHRDELNLRLGDGAVRGFASQGQQRAVVLALQIGEMEIIEGLRAVRPILILDDVSSELDRARTESLFKALDGRSRQVVLTTTRPDLIAPELYHAPERRDFHVAEGRVEAAPRAGE